MSVPAPLDVVALSPVSTATVLWRSLGVLRVTVLVKASFALAHDAAATPIAPAAIEREERFREGDTAGSPRRGSDLAPRLPSAGVVLTGHAFAPGGVPATAISARLALFRDRPLLDKTIHVFGDVPPGGAGPAPFQRMALVHERAYGGPSVDANPIGVGAPGTAARPNLVDPRDPTRPACFAPISSRWPVRARALGSLDPRAELLEIPEGFDFRAFNPAPLDQQIPFLSGDEWIVMDNLSAAHPRLQTRLPSARGRVRFHLITAGGASSGRDLELVLDTLTIDADELVLSLVWRGHFPLEIPELLPQVRLFAGLEVPGQEISWPTLGKLTNAAGPAAGGGLGQTGSALLDVYGGAALPFVEGDTTAVGASAFRAPQTSERRVDLGQTMGAAPASKPALPFGPAAPGLAHAKALDDARLPQIPGAPWSGVAIAPLDVPEDSTLVFANELVAQAPPPPPPVAAPPPRMAPPPVAALPPRMAPPPVAAPPPRMAPPPVAAPPPRMVPPPVAAPPSVSPPFQASKPASASAPAASAPEANRAAPRVEGEARKRATAKLTTGAAFDDEDLSGADLSGLDFSGRSLTRCKLRGADLRGAKLVSAKLVGAQLVGADLTDATLEGADLGRADLSRAILVNACFDRATLVDTKLSGADGTRASFRYASGQRTGFSKGTFTGAVFDAAELGAADFSGATLEGASLRGASLPDARLTEVNANDAVFDDARVRGARAKGAHLERASLRGVDAQGATFAKALLSDASLANADLQGANLSEAACAGASFEGANLSEAVLEDADLTGARLANANLEGATLARVLGEDADLREAKLTRADLRGAKFARASFASAGMRDVRAEEADFTGASFVRADLGHAGMRSAKLAGANLAHARLDATDLRGANLEGAKVHGASRHSAKMAGANVKDLDERARDS